MNTVISDVKAKAYIPKGVRSVSNGQEAANVDSFSQIFSKTQGTEETSNKEEGVKMETAKTEENTKAEDVNGIQKHTNIRKNKTSENLEEQSQEVKVLEESQEMETAMTEAAGVMVETIAEMFDISVEEVEQVLETLGLTDLDLLSSENLTQVVLALNPDCDAMALMTDEELFADLKALMSTAEELKNQLVQNFNLSEEEVNQIISSMKEMPQMQNAEDMTELEIKGVSHETEAVEEVADESVNLQVEVAENFINHAKENGITKIRDIKTNDVIAKETVNQVEEAVVSQAKDSQPLQRDTSENGKDTSEQPAQSFGQNILNQLAEAVENVESATTSYSVRGQDIIRQVTEQIRVHVTQETTEMELQLHPASLGNVKVQIASTGGILTAVFTTENEAVKTALESQLVQLKESFAAQGLKVESVEVNVSTQGFERSLDQQEQEQNRFENNRSKKGNRRIRLDSIDDVEDLLDQDMSEGDKIVADMMLRNGNTVDYTV